MIPRYQTYEPDYTLAQKIAIFAAAVFTLVMIGIAGKFAYQFVQTYRDTLNQAMLYALGFIAVLGLILLTYAAFYIMAILALNYQTKRLYAEEQRQNLQSVNANNQLFVATAKAIESGTVYLSEQRTEQGVVKFKSLPKHSKQTPAEQLLSLSELNATASIKDSLLTDISECQRLLIVGGSGTGKTSLLLHIAKQRAELGDLIILDSNGKKGKWGAYPVIGLGYDHSAIKEKLIVLNDLLQTRFKEYAFGNVGERDHPLITIIADEWHIISTEIKDIADLTRPILTQG